MICGQNEKLCQTDSPWGLFEDVIDEAILLKAVMNQRWGEMQLCLRVGLELKIFW